MRLCNFRIEILKIFYVQIGIPKSKSEFRSLNRNSEVEIGIPKSKSKSVSKFRSRNRKRNLNSDVEIETEIGIPISTSKSKSKFREIETTDFRGNPIPDGQGGSFVVFFDIIEGQVLDRYDNVLRYVKQPSSEIINEFRDKVSKTAPPLWFRDELGQIRLKSHPVIVFNTDTKNWVHLETKWLIPGFSKPLAG
jgi:hypothetical protein